MCPSYQATRDEKDSTRGRARVLQEMVNGTLVRRLARPRSREALDLCLSCKACAAECPAGVDMATYKSEALYQAYRQPGRAAHYAWASCPAGPRWPRTPTARLANAACPAWRARPSGRRRGPAPVPARFAPQTFRAWFGKRRLDRPGAARPRYGGCPPGRTARPAPRPPPRPVLLLVDTFTNAFAPRSARPRCGCSRPPATRSRSPTGRSAAG